MVSIRTCCAFAYRVLHIFHSEGLCLLLDHMVHHMYHVTGMLRGWAQYVEPSCTCHDCDPICQLSQNSDVTRVVVKVVPTLHALKARQRQTS